MAYSLGNVKSHVAAAANEIGPKFAVKTVYGFSFRNIAGTSTLSDHARGLALDFMTNDLGARTGIAEYAKANASRLGVTYIIHDRKIWNAARSSEGWRPYTGVSPHTDHTHISFSASGAGVGNVIDIPNPLDTAGQLASDVKAIYGVVQSFAKAAAWLSNPVNSLRIGMFLVGIVLMLVALIGAERSLGAVQTTAKGAANAAAQS